MRLKERPTPFLIPADLAEMLFRLVLEYGTGGGIGQHLPCSAVWAIEGDDSAVLGYVWLADRVGRDNGTERQVNVAVLDVYQGTKVGTFALLEIEKVVVNDGVFELWCQVNSCKENGGKRVRRWLLQQGYKPIKDQHAPKPYSEMEADEFALRYPGVVYFVKALKTAS